MESLQPEATSCHVRCADSAGVLRALREMKGGGEPVPVWPPRPLPAGLFVSPARYGWISIWGNPEQSEQMLTTLTATLECPGVLFRTVEETFWLAMIYQDGRLLARVSSPETALQELEAYSKAWDELTEEGLDDPSQAPDMWHERAEDLLEEGAVGPVLWDDPAVEAAIRTILPAGRSVEETVKLARGTAQPPPAGHAPEPEFLEDHLDTFANFLDIRDASWDPGHDEETLRTGDYEDVDGLPERWDEFVLLPEGSWQLPMFSGFAEDEA